MSKRVFAMAFFLTICILNGCGSEPEVPEPAVRPVKYALIGPAGAVQSRRFVGTAKAGLEARLSFRASGLIESIPVQVGDRIEAGQIIASLDNRDAVIALEQARSALENARVQKANAQSNLIRVRQLYQAYNISLAEYEQAKNGFSSATSSYESARKSLDLQELQLSYNELRAPIAGIVTDVRNEVNEVVRAGDPVVVLSAGADIEMEVGIPEAHISRIRQGDGVRVRFSALPDRSFSGQVREIAFSLDASSTYPVIVRLDTPSSFIRPGMAGEVEFSFGDGGLSDQLVVPVNAVGEGADGSFVFVIEGVSEGIGTVKRQAIRTGPLLENGFVVQNGLSDGDLVATAGLRFLLNGMKVRLLEE